MGDVIIRNYQACDIEKLARFFERYRGAFPDAKLAPPEYYTYDPTLGGGRNVFCALDRQERIVGFAPVFPAPANEEGGPEEPHHIWTVVVADPGASNAGQARTGIRALDVDGWVLLLGVGIGYCSSMHQAEVGVQLLEAIKRYWQVPEDIQRDCPDDIYISYGGTPDDAWAKVQAEAERRGQVWRHRIGQAECVLFKAHVVVGIYGEWLRTDPFELHGVDKDAWDDP